MSKTPKVNCFAGFYHHASFGDHESAYSCVSLIFVSDMIPCTALVYSYWASYHDVYNT